MKLKSLLWLFVFAVVAACADRIEIGETGTNTQLVVDGFISNEQGPYTIKLSRPSKLGGNLIPPNPVNARQVTLFDDLGDSETLNAVSEGVYQTSPSGIQGQVGRSYFIRIETRDGKVYESTPEKILPAGSVDSVYVEFVTIKNSDATTTYGFNVFADFKDNEEGNDNLFRWRYKGTYRVETQPELRTQTAGEGSVPWPPECSGWVYSNRNLYQVGDCTCCICWPSFVDNTPLLNDEQLSVNGKHTHVRIGFVPVQYWTFFDKVRVEARQLSLNRSAYTFWKTVRDQKDGATSIFQPSIGNPKSNLFSKGGDGNPVLGYFYATGVSKKHIYLNANDIPLGGQIIPTAPPPITKSCLEAFKNSTNQKPNDW